MRTQLHGRMMALLHSDLFHLYSIANQLLHENDFVCFPFFPPSFLPRHPNNFDCPSRFYYADAGPVGVVAVASGSILLYTCTVLSYKRLLLKSIDQTVFQQAGHVIPYPDLNLSKRLGEKIK